MKHTHLQIGLAVEAISKKLKPLRNRRNELMLEVCEIEDKIDFWNEKISQILAEEIVNERSALG